MPNDFYNPTGNPADNSNIVSSDMRAEFAAIVAGFNKLPTLTGNANKLVVINSSGTGMDVTTAPAGLTSVNKIALTQPANGATLTIIDGKTLTVNKTLTFDGTDSTVMTFPATSATLARTDAAQTFTGTQTFSGLIAANLGLTVAGANFTSRGITDAATAVALTLSGSGANSVTIANSAGNPTIGTSAGGLSLSAQTLIGTNSTDYIAVTGGTGNVILSAAGGSANVQLSYTPKGTGGHVFNAGDGGLQLFINPTASADRYVTLTGSNGGNPTIGTSAGSLALSAAVVAASTVTVGTNLFANGYAQVNSDDATPAGGAVNTGLFFGSSAIGIYFGSGAPTVSAAKGSLYIRSDGSSTSTRSYINTDGGTTWTAVTTVA